MRTLVIGGTGYLGSHIVERLHARGFEVTVFARGRTRAQLPDAVTTAVGDRHSRDDLLRASRRPFDAVVDVAAYRRDETQLLVDVFDGRVDRFVHISTVSANRLSSGRPLRESDPLVSDPSAGYGYDKAECERALNQAHAKSDFPFVSIRPVVIFGPRDRISRENYYIQRLVAGDPILLPDGGYLPVFGVFARDVADAVAGAIVSEAAPGRSYHVMMRERLTLAQHVAAIARLVGRDAETIAVPSRLLRRAGFNMSWFPYYSGDSPIDLDTTAAERDLGWRPTPYDEALDATVRYFLDRGPESLPSIEDRFPPVMPRDRQTRFARVYAERIAVLEEVLSAEC
jgi:nucleoside-diphosphate-sugar epimerase